MERKTIKIISVASDWKPVGKAKVLTFAGEDRVNYETWSETLAEHIKIGATIEADVEFSEKVSGDQTYFHNKIVQIYVDGQPIKSKGRGFTPDSPEKINSIESQKRADLICQLWIVGKIADDNVLVGKALRWLDKLGEAALPVKTETRQASTSAPGTFTNAGEFLTACQKNLGLNKTQTIAKLRSLNVDVKAETIESLCFTDAYQLLKENK